MSLAFEETPNYNFLRFLLQKNLMNQNISPDPKINFTRQKSISPLKITIISEESIEYSNEAYNEGKDEICVKITEKFSKKPCFL